MSARTLLSARGLVVDRGARKVLRDVDFSLSEGEVVGLLGVNGSGKSTLLESLAGLHPMTGGSVQRNDRGFETTVRDSEGQRGDISGFGLCLQTEGMSGDETVLERIRGACRVAGLADNSEALNEIISEWGLGHRADDRICKLSGGLRRRVAVLSAIVPVALNSEPSVVLLDEPSEGLDQSSRGQLLGWLRALAMRGHGVLVATHDPEVITACDRTVTISETSELTSKVQESNLEHTNLPDPSASEYHRELVAWTWRLERRNPIDTIGRGVPALVALLLAFTLSTDIARSSENYDLLAALILTPAFITAIVTPAIIKRLAEERAGDWWRAMTGASSRGWFSIMGVSLILPLPIIYISWFVIADDTALEAMNSDVMLWLWLFAFLIIDLSVAASALHLMVSDLTRAGAVAGILLQLVLIWPFLQMTSALTSIMSNGMSFELALGEPIADIAIAWLTVVLLWAMAVIIPED
ncbi:MAG: ABC transporter ATP-binding protein [Candidatus Thalassarchaeum sp.]|nr:ABC transporter ATP-binding protein [Candidatus Thalassarchaeum sp.]